MIKAFGPTTRIFNVFSIQRIRVLTWFVLLGATAFLVQAEVNREPMPAGIQTHRDLVYRTDHRREVRLDLYLPQRPSGLRRVPAVILIHGGGWRGGSKESVKGMAIQLAKGGYAVAAIDYLLSRPTRASWPTNFEDCQEAVRWVRSHAADYRIDPARLAAVGVSAGGHLASLLGTWPERPDRPASNGTDSPPSLRISARVQAVVSMYGPTDLAGGRTMAPLPTSPVQLMLGGEKRERERAYREATPINHVSSDDPPVLLIHGRDDQLVPPEQSVALAFALESAGVKNRLILIDHAAHGFGFHVRNRQILPDILAFLDSVWNVKR